jgi:hypothetical protein
LPHSLGRTLAGLNKTHIVLPNIESILKPGEQELLQIHLNSTVHLRDIDDAINEAMVIKNQAELDVTTVLGNLRRAEPTSTSTMYWIIGISICTLLAIILCCYYYRGFIKRNLGIYILRRSQKATPFPRPRRRTRTDTRYRMDSSVL